MSTEYRVELDLFSGPLDLLLYLVRRNEVDILHLRIAEITAQFSEFLEVLQFLDLDLVGDFVVMASTLVELKSRAVLPQPAEEEEKEPEIADDTQSDLIRQLLEYKKFKDAAKELEKQAALWQERYPRLSNDRPRQGKNHAADRIKEVELWDLVSALGRVLRRKDVDRESSIRYDDTPQSVYIEQVGSRVRAEKRVGFTSFFDEATTRSQIAGIFLAILELLRNHAFRAEQTEDFGEIWILAPSLGATQQAESARTDTSGNHAATLSLPLPQPESPDEATAGETLGASDLPAAPGRPADTPDGGE
jgi:segregation and condensation protein A